MSLTRSTASSEVCGGWLDQTLNPVPATLSPKLRTRGPGEAFGGLGLRSARLCQGIQEMDMAPMLFCTEHVYLYVTIRVCLRICTYMYANVHIFTHAHVHACIHACMHTYQHTHTFACWRAYLLP